MLGVGAPALTGLLAACSLGGDDDDDDDDGNTGDSGAVEPTATDAEDVAQQPTATEAPEEEMSGPEIVVIRQEGVLVDPPAGAEPSGWDTEESIRGGMQLVAQFDSSGEDAWDVAEHPLVYMTSESSFTWNPDYPEDEYIAGFHIIDAYSKELVAAWIISEPMFNDAFGGRGPHGFCTSPDGQWGYTTWSEQDDEAEYYYTAIVNMRTLKLDKVLTMNRKTGWDLTGRSQLFGTDSKPLHHTQAFWDWEGNERIVLQYGFGSRGGPHFILDPNDDNRVWKAITYDEVHPQGHPFTTPSPDGRFIYISLGAAWLQNSEIPHAGIHKLDMETGEVAVIEKVGHHPIGICHTADGRFTYANDGHGSHTYKIDNETNEVVASTSAGVAGPYGIAFNWDETRLFTVGKGEGSHNRGGHLGMVDTTIMRQSRQLPQMPITLGGSAASVDHAILHPDPEVNELWVSNMAGWETIVLSLETYEPTNWIATPNGGDTHSGCFVRYEADWTGELQSDMGGPKSAAMLDEVRARSEHP